MLHLKCIGGMPERFHTFTKPRARTNNDAVASVGIFGAKMLESLQAFRKHEATVLKGSNEPGADPAGSIVGEKGEGVGGGGDDDGDNGDDAADDDGADGNGRGDDEAEESPPQSAQSGNISFL